MGLVSMSGNQWWVSTWHMTASPLEIAALKRWYFNAMYLVLIVFFLDYATAMQLVLSSQTLHFIFGFEYPM